jgi:hypothetical protein
MAAAVASGAGRGKAGDDDSARQQNDESFLKMACVKRGRRSEIDAAVSKDEGNAAAADAAAADAAAAALAVDAGGAVLAVNFAAEKEGDNTVGDF